MRLLVCGGRHFEDAELVHRELTRLHWRKRISVLIHGSVTGAGIAAEAWARRHGVAVVRYPPNWELYGKKAEWLRSAFMLEDSRPALVVAFPGGRHTADLVQRAISAQIAVLVIPTANGATFGSLRTCRSGMASQPLRSEVSEPAATRFALKGV